MEKITSAFCNLETELVLHLMIFVLTVQFYPGGPLQGGSQAVVAVMQLPVGCPIHTGRKRIIIIILYSPIHSFFKSK